LTASFKIAPLGQETIYDDFKFPQIIGDFLFRAVIDYRGNGTTVLTQSRRHVKLVEPAKKQATPGVESSRNG
jgi:hypothetical protein